MASKKSKEQWAEEVFDNWKGLDGNGFFTIICQTFNLPSPNDDDYVYRAESFAMTMAQIQEQVTTGKVKYKYQAHGKQIEVSSEDIASYTNIFSPSKDTTKALTNFLSNAKKQSPRETVAQYLQSRRIPPSYTLSRARKHINPYLDIWAHSCQLIAFLGPLPDPSYADPANAKQTHPILPVLYHHFGCVIPTYEALCILQQLTLETNAKGVIDMGCGNGYWSYMLRRMSIETIAVDSMDSEYRTMWLDDVVKADGPVYLKRITGGKDYVLLMVYPIVAGNFSQAVIQAYNGDTIIIVGTQNVNRYTGFSDSTVEEWFETEMKDWNLVCRVAMPSFAGKDECLMAWKRN